MKVHDTGMEYDQSLHKPSSFVTVVEPFTPVSKKKQPVDSTFRLLHLTFKTFGITFKECASNFSFLKTSTWDALNLLAVCLTSLITYSTIHLINFTPQMLFTYYVHIGLGLVLRVTLMSNRQKVNLVMNDVRALFQQLDMTSKIYKLKLKRQFYAFSVYFLSITLILISYFYQQFNEKLNFSLLGFPIDASNRFYVLNGIRFSLIFTCASSASMSFLALILCCNFYIIATEILIEYGENLKNITRTRNFSKNFLISSISNYKLTLRIFKDIDLSIASSCFLLYASSVCCFLNIVAAAFYNAKFSSNIIDSSQMLLSLVMAIVIFFSLTLTGTRANSVHDKLKMVLIECAEVSLLKDPETLEAFRIVSESIRGTKGCFTAGEMFVIDKSLILTTTGALVTYGALLFQNTNQ